MSEGNTISLCESLDKLANQVLESTANRRYWLIRTSSGTLYPEFVDNSYVALNRNSIPYSELRSAKEEYGQANQTIKKVKDTLMERGIIGCLEETSNNPERALSIAISQVYKFVYEIKKNDIVVIPSENSDYISIGYFNDNYIADNSETNASFSYTRKVTWLRSISKRLFDPYFYKLFTAHQAICDISEYAEYIERNISTQFILDDQSHYVIAINSQNISARYLFRFGNYILDALADFVRVNQLDINVDAIQLSVNVNSPGKIDFKSSVKVGILTTMFTSAILGGCYIPKYISDNDLSIETVQQYIHNFKNDNSERIEELERLMNSLEAQNIEESYDIIERE